MSIELHFDVPFIAAMALKEKQIQQNYRPIIAVHKWFARRPGTLFRGLTLAEFGDKPLREIFFEANDFPGKRVCDPFMGGGTPLLEANRVGCDVLGYDINPMAAWIVREEIERLDIRAYRTAAGKLVDMLAVELGHLYVTDCPLYGDVNVPIKYALWVKVLDCACCGERVDLFPGYLIADTSRHTTNVVVCATCGELNDVRDLHRPGNCASCYAALSVDGPAKRNQCQCRACGRVNRYPDGRRPYRHRLFAIEYHNARRKARHVGRFFKKPDMKDLAVAADAEARWESMTPRFVPDSAIPAGDETDRLHRWGYRLYSELFGSRQLVGLERSCQLIADVEDKRIRFALATNLSDLLRYQNMLCRYDTRALKSLDIFSIHGFPVGLIQCESNLLGIMNGQGASVGSGGWTNIIEKYAKAKRYCDDPFEVRHTSGGAETVPILGEWIGERSTSARSRRVIIHCGSVDNENLAPGIVDAVFTDPPYYGNVQYGELMDFCYVWLRRLVGADAEGFEPANLHSSQELTGNVTQGRGIEHFASGLSAIYRKAAYLLRPGAPLAFTFHHNKLDPYYAVGVAILDAGLSCTATLPCPAEMSGSIHIQRTGSSIVDTIFVCRKLDEPLPLPSLDDIRVDIVSQIQELETAGLRTSRGDVRCITYGHLSRLAIQSLRPTWDSTLGVEARLGIFARALNGLVDHAGLILGISDDRRLASPSAVRSARRGESPRVAAIRSSV